MSDFGRSYLTPYENAAARHGSGFGSLLWASPATQAARFDAIRELADCRGQNVLDVGCGRADFFDYLVDHDSRPAHYVGIEAVSVLHDAAKSKRLTDVVLVNADFVQEPVLMFVGADVIVFSGSLNTLDAETFYKTVTHAWRATAGALVFNFLSSPRLAAAAYLTWHARDDVLRFARTHAERVAVRENYLEGDCTIAMYNDER